MHYSDNIGLGQPQLLQFTDFRLVKNTIVLLLVAEHGAIHVDNLQVLQPPTCSSGQQLDAISGRSPSRTALSKTALKAMLSAESLRSPSTCWNCVPISFTSSASRSTAITEASRFNPVTVEGRITANVIVVDPISWTGMVRNQVRVPPSFQGLPKLCPVSISH